MLCSATVGISRTGLVGATACVSPAEFAQDVITRDRSPPEVRSKGPRRDRHEPSDRGSSFTSLEGDDTRPSLHHRHALPVEVLRFMGLFDREARGMVPFLGKRAALDNRATFELLDWKPTPIETSFREMARALSAWPALGTTPSGPTSSQLRGAPSTRPPMALNKQD